MKWVSRISLTKIPYVALVTEDEARELGRYYVVEYADGDKSHYLPVTKQRNAKARASEDEARRFVLDQVLERMEGEMGEVRRMKEEGRRGKEILTANER